MKISLWSRLMTEVRWKNYVDEVFGLDLRSLGLFRILLGLILILDLVNRAADLTVHYTDLGVLPRAFFFEKISRTFYISFHFMNGSFWFQNLLFIIAGVAAFLLMIGYRTRLMVFISWLFLVSLNARNPGVLQGGDVELRLLLFWSLFLPLGARFSIDSALSPNADHLRTNRIVSVGTFVYLVQIFLVYFTAALIKTGKEWRSEGTAIYYTLHLDVFTTYFGKWLLSLGELLTPMTIGVWYFELLGMFLFLIPGLQFLLRPLGILLFVGMHFGFFLTLRLGLFPWISMLAFVPFIPTYIWNLRKPKTTKHMQIFYDPVCRFCKKLAFLFASLVGIPKSEVQGAIPETEVYRQMRENNSWVITDENEKLHFKSQALKLILSNSFIGSFFRVIPNLEKLFINDKLYEWIANNRLRLSKFTKFLPSKKIDLELSNFSKSIVIFSISAVVVWNWGMVDRFISVPDFIRNYALHLRLDQHWNMFAPYPLKVDGWFIGHAKLVNGKELDILRWEFEGVKEPPNENKPDHVSATFPNQRWRKYIMNMNEREGRIYSEGFARYLCRHWNSQHKGGERLEELELVFMRERTPPPGEKFEVTKTVLWKHWCLRTSIPKKTR